jgi:hypothetical protein
LPLRLVDRQAIPRFLLSVDDEGDDGRDSGSLPPLSESPPNLEDPDPVGVELSAPPETEGDEANDDDEQEDQASSESQERPRLSLNIPPSRFRIGVGEHVQKGSATTAHPHAVRCQCEWFSRARVL